MSCATTWNCWKARPTPSTQEAYLAGLQTPVFFGSAINTFGVQQLLDTFVEHAPAPLPRETATRTVSPYEEPFTGFVFKIQANMDPAHRDRIAFFRICSGKFTRGMKVRHIRLGRDVQIANATIFMAQDRTNVDEAWPGDIIGIHNHGTIKIGDTFTQGEELKFTGIPNFAPEHFRKVRLLNPMKSKALEKGLVQLAEEGDHPGVPAADGRGLDRRRGRTAAVRRGHAPPGARIRGQGHLRAGQLCHGPLGHRRKEKAGGVREKGGDALYIGRRRQPGLPGRQPVASGQHHGELEGTGVPRDQRA